jgi:Tfp pilus assembly protein PilV
MCSDERRSTDHRRQRGVSLLEALAAMTVLSVGLLAFAGNSVSLTRGLKAADSTAAGTALALQKLEQLRSMPLGATQLATGLYYDPSNPLKADGTSGGPFTRSWVVSSNDTPRFGLKTVTVTVSWRDSSAHETRVAAYVRCSTIPCP